MKEWGDVSSFVRVEFCVVIMYCWVCRGKVRLEMGRRRDGACKATLPWGKPQQTGLALTDSESWVFDVPGGRQEKWWEIWPSGDSSRSDFFLPAAVLVPGCGGGFVVLSRLWCELQLRCVFGPGNGSEESC